MDPIFVCLWVFAGLTVVTWLLSVATGEHSWVDRIWSIVPVAYMWIFASAAGLADSRLNLIAILVTLWGARLTFNFARKGGYTAGGEDYRWAVLRNRMKRWQFELFNIFFINIYQNVILLLIALPAFTAYQNRTPLGVLDVIAAVFFLVFLGGETLADQQQWRFQQWKKSESRRGRSPRPRFVQTGLFRFSRHPNFFCEQAQWWVIFFFGAIAAGSVLQWTLLGAVLLTGLFVGSTIFTERITRSRYPEYAAYQKATSAIVPWFPSAVSASAPADARPSAPSPD